MTFGSSLLVSSIGSDALSFSRSSIFSIGSLHSTALATVTQSLVIVGYDPFSMATFLPFGHIVTFTVSDTSFIHFIIESLTPVSFTSFMVRLYL